jgi:hypothetical protein
MTPAAEDSNPSVQRRVEAKPIKKYPAVAPEGVQSSLHDPERPRRNLGGIPLPLKRFDHFFLFGDGALFSPDCIVCTP